MPDLGWQEILVVLVIALLVLGPAKLPGAARSAGKAIQEFKSGLGGLAGLNDIGGNRSASEPVNDDERTSDVTTKTSTERASELPPAGLPPAAPAPAAVTPDAAHRRAGTHR